MSMTFVLRLSSTRRKFDIHVGNGDLQTYKRMCMMMTFVLRLSYTRRKFDIHVRNGDLQTYKRMS